MYILDDKSLSSQQIEAINESSSVFLIACPGSGKTRTLTYKIAKELYELNDNSKWVVAITYTNRAADEIKDRVENLGIDISRLWIGTIHSFCLEWILKPYACYHPLLKYGFRIINPNEVEEIYTKLCAPYNNPRLTYFDCNYFYNSNGIVLPCGNGKRKSVGKVISDYHDILKKNRQIDFEQILFLSFKIFSDFPVISKNLSKLFSYILVDEYQDTKEIQYMIFSKILKSGDREVKTFIVGDPNQSIFNSLGGYAINFEDLKGMCEIEIEKKELTGNYRSSSRIVNYFDYYKVYNSTIFSVGNLRDFTSTIKFNKTVTKENLAEELAKIIVHNVEVLDIDQNEICIVAHWWIHLGSITRALTNLLPDYDFNGPGLSPLSRDEENFFYKLARIILTDPSPKVYSRRIRWSSELVSMLEGANVTELGFSNKNILNIINSILVDENNGLEYLRQFFYKFFRNLKIDFNSNALLKEHYESFFNSAQKRINKIQKENNSYEGNIENFRKVFKIKKGITVSTIHGVKGGEYDVVIAYGLLEGIVPHFQDVDPDSAKKLMYVIGSRAKKHLYLISEKNRGTKYYPKHPTSVLNAYAFKYD